MKIISEERIWDRERKLIELTQPEMKWVGKRLPNPLDVYRIMYLKSQALENNPVNLTREYVEASQEQARKDIEETWGVKFSQPLEVEVVPHESFNIAYNQLEAEVCDALSVPFHYGSKPSCQSYISSHHSKIIFPDLRPTLSQTGAIPWRDEAFNLALTTRMSYALIHQIRGEWGEDFVSAELGKTEATKDKTSKIKVAVTQYSNESLANRYPSRGIETVSDVFYIPDSYSDYLVSTYSLAQVMPLWKIALTDDLILDRSKSKVKGIFDPNHPTCKTRMEKFQK
ncbi:MAG: hypothetical protein AABW82_01105 [Nanoarchaeota archaeon]